MSTNRHPLDDLFRQGAGQREFPFQESYWLQAEQMILAEQKRRKQYLLSLISYALIVVTVISIPLLVWIFSANPLFAELRPVEQPFAMQTLLTSPDALTQGVSLATSVVSPSGERSLSSQAVYEQSRNSQVSAESVRQERTNQRIGSPQIAITIVDQEDKLSLALEDDIVATDKSNSLKRLKKLQFAQPIVALSSQFGGKFAVPEVGYPRNELSLWLGFNLSPNANSFNDWGSHPVLGLRYAYALNRRLKLYTGLMYQGRGAVNALTNIRQIDYGFGADIDATVLNIDRLHYLEVPLGIDLRVYKSHYLLLGTQLSYLLNASGTLTNRSENSFGLLDESENATWGYTQGLRKWNPALTVGYAYYWKRGLRIGASTNYNLKNPFQDDFYLERDLSRFQLRVFAEFYLSHF
ncbi:MAG: outer membrane beta-barrel protein [Bacteroidia bacterium]